MRYWIYRVLAEGRELILWPGHLGWIDATTQESSAEGFERYEDVVSALQTFQHETMQIVGWVGDPPYKLTVQKHLFGDLDD